MSKTDALLERARRINPVPRDAYAHLAESPEAKDILEQIFSREAADTTRVPRRTRQGRRHVTLRLRALGVAALAVAAAIALVVMDGSAPDREGPEKRPEWSAQLVNLAERSPRLLLDQSEWKVVDANEFDSEDGEMAFENGRDCDEAPLKPGCYWVGLTWRAADTHSHYFADRKRGADKSFDLTIDGHEATVFEHDNTVFGKTFYAMWVDGRHSLELRTDVVPTLDEFLAIASTLREVDTDTWLTALPASVVKPDDRAAAVDRILADLPVPAGLDVGALRGSERVRDDYQLVDEVRNAVVCAWVQRWVDGHRTGDEAAMQQAADTLARGNEWLGDPEGRWGQSYVKDVADAMATNSPVLGGAAYRSLPIGQGYQRHLGCPEK